MDEAMVQDDHLIELDEMGELDDLDLEFNERVEDNDEEELDEYEMVSLSFFYALGILFLLARYCTIST